MKEIVRLFVERGSKSGITYNCAVKGFEMIFEKMSTFMALDTS